MTISSANEGVDIKYCSFDFMSIYLNRIAGEYSAGMHCTGNKFTDTYLNDINYVDFHCRAEYTCNGY